MTSKVKRHGYFLSSLWIAVSVWLCTSYLSGLPVAAHEAPQQASPGTSAAQPPAKAHSQTEIALKDIRDAARRLRAAALDLISDVEQRSMVVVGQPMIIEPSAAEDPQNKPLGWAEQAIDLGPALPPRKKWLDASLSHLGQIVTILSTDFAAAQIPSDQQSAVQTHWDEMKAVVQDIQSRYEKLKSLTQGPDFDNIAIGKEALGIYDDVAKLDKPWRQVVHILRKKG